MCHLPYTGHAGAPENCLRAFYGHKIVGSFACSAFSMALLRLYGSKISSKNLVGPHGMCYDYPRVPTVLALTGPVNCPGDSFDLSIISAYEITLARCCDHKCFTGFISVLTTFWPRDFKNPYVYPLEFRKMHMQVPCGPVRMPYENTRMIGRVGCVGRGAHRTQ